MPTPPAPGADQSVAPEVTTTPTRAADPDEPATGRNARVLAGLAGAAALLLAVSLVVAVGGPERGGSGPEASTRTAPRGSSGRLDGSPDGRDVLDRVAQQLSVEPAGVLPGVAKFTLSASSLPAAVHLTVKNDTGPLVVRTLMVTSRDGRRVVLDGLPAGWSQWKVTSPDVVPVSGRVWVPPPPSPSPTATPHRRGRPAATAQPDPPAQPRPTAQPDATAQPATPQPHPTTEPPAQPTAEPHPSTQPHPPTQPQPRAQPDRAAHRPRHGGAAPGGLRRPTMIENTRAASHVRRPSLLLALLLVTAGLLAVDRAADATPVAASYAGEKAHRWTGYRIPRNGHADGGWVGGYQVGDTPVFVVTPTKRPNRKGYEAAHEVANLDKARGPSRVATARAAWVLSKYGGYRDALQAAAVDAVVYHLLVGGRWRIGHARGAARIRHCSDPASVRRFARIMLDQARKFAGVYRVTVSATSADVGGTIEATVRVTGGHDRPAAGLPVSVSVPGLAPADGVTGDDGRTVARFPASQRGWHEVTASVGEVPEHHLLVREPVKRAQAAAAEGGVRRTVTATTLAAVRGPQTLTMQATPDTLVVGKQAAVTASIAGDGSPRTATAVLYGPFAAASAATCSGPQAGRRRRRP